MLVFLSIVSFHAGNCSIWTVTCSHNMVCNIGCMFYRLLVMLWFCVNDKTIWNLTADTIPVCFGTRLGSKHWVIRRIGKEEKFSSLPSFLSCKINPQRCTHTIHAVSTHVCVCVCVCVCVIFYSSRTISASRCIFYFTAARHKPYQCIVNRVLSPQHVMHIYKPRNKSAPPNDRLCTLYMAMRVSD